MKMKMTKTSLRRLRFCLLTVVIAGCKSTPPPPTLTSVETHVCSGGGFLRIGGTHLRSDTVVTLTSTTNAAISYKATPPNMGVTCSGKDCTVIDAVFGPVPAGDYNVTAANGDGKPVTAPNNPITVRDDPIVVFSEPDVVWNGAAMSIHVYMSAVRPPITKLQIAPVGGGAPVDLTGLVTPVGDHPDQAIATVPAGTAAGTYDLLVTDSSACVAAKLSSALRVVGDTTLTLAGITPRFGWRQTAVSVTISAAAPSMFSELPRAYLLQNGVLVAMTSMARFSSTTLTAVVPPDPMRPTGAWDVIVVNQDGTVGRLATAFTVTDGEPPVVASINPATIPTAATTTVTIAGRNFSTPPPYVTLKCMDPGTPKPASGPPVPPKPTPDQGPLMAKAGATATRIQIDVDATAAAYAEGANCQVLVTNSDAAGAAAEFGSLVMVPNKNLTGFFSGSMLNVARRGLAAVGGQATQAARFVYAIGGDNAGGALDTIETLPVNVFGQPGAAGFFTQRYRLGAPRTQLGAVRVGRFIYAIGGTSAAADATKALATIERAAILDPAVRPGNVNVTLNLGGATGVGGGLYYYRVAAIMAATDAFNPSGESLPSDTFGVKVPALANVKVQTVLTWDTLPGAAGYVVYRTNAGDAAGNEQLIIDTTAASPPAGIVCDAPTATTQRCIDSGAVAAMPAQTPLPLGSTGVWRPAGASLASKRQGVGVTAIVTDATTTRLYVFGGKNEVGAGGTVLGTFESFAITTAADGSQTLGPPSAATAFGPARWKLRAWSEMIGSPPAPYVWVGGGFTDAAATAQPSKDVQGSPIQADGTLGTITTTTDFPTTSTGIAGFGAFSLGPYLFAVGGTRYDTATTSNFISDDGTSTPVPASTPAALTGWNSCSQCLNQRRTDPGAAVQSGYFWVLGGDTPTGPTKSTEYVLY